MEISSYAVHDIKNKVEIWIATLFTDKMVSYFPRWVAWTIHYFKKTWKNLNLSYLFWLVRGMGRWQTLPAFIGGPPALIPQNFFFVKIHEMYQKGNIFDFFKMYKNTAEIPDNWRKFGICREDLYTLWNTIDLQSPTLSH